MSRMKFIQQFLAAETIEEVYAIIDTLPLLAGMSAAQHLLNKAEAKESFRGTVQEYEEQGLVGPEAVHAAAQAVWGETITWDGQHR